tara:strand:+ start:54477 stop:54716 length:240 start_codon:yes stop_codon:yes gene_type:complete
MKNFICAYFGSDWTITTRGFSSARQAEKHGLYMMPTAGIFGFAVIEENTSSWDVNWDRSILSGKETITLTNFGNFEVSF